MLHSLKMGDGKLILFGNAFAWFCRTVALTSDGG